MLISNIDRCSKIVGEARYGVLCFFFSLTPLSLYVFSLVVELLYYYYYYHLCYFCFLCVCFARGRFLFSFLFLSRVCFFSDKKGRAGDLCFYTRWLVQKMKSTIRLRRKAAFHAPPFSAPLSVSERRLESTQWQVSISFSCPTMVVALPRCSLQCQCE